ncbi:hypothetical protein [Thiohalocapsa marina]|uniref:hypothetical protein n=1 Tax=Thiohalocapsa marina TaxID=424902 RepID=UPI0036DEE3BB
MARTYDLNTKQAAAADNTMSRIEETGKYVGTLTRAEAVVSTRNTEGVEFSFRADDGATADFLTLWTYNEAGDELPALKMLNAMMTVLRVKTISPTSGQVEKWDSTAGARIKTAATIFPELTGRRIGLLLQREEYQKRDGSIGSKMNIWAVFDADSELTASEILSRKTQPETLAKMLLTMKDKPLKGGQQYRQPQSAAATQGEAFEDDDVPF